MQATRAAEIRDDAVFDLSREEIDRYPVGVITLDRAGIVTGYNAAESAFSRMRPEDVLGRRFFGDVAPCAAVRDFQGRFEAFAQGDGDGAERFDFRFAFHWGLQDVTITLLRRGGRDEIHVVVRTKMQRANVARALASPALPADESEPGPIPLGVWERDERTGVTHASDELRRILGETGSGPLRDGGVLSYVDPDDAGFVGNAEARALGDRHEVRVRCTLRGADGQSRRVELQAATIRDADGCPLRTYGAVVDLSRERRLWRTANFDTLTQLPNRRYFHERLGAALARDPRAAVMYVDLAGIKHLNDTFGHDVGDEILRQTGARLAIAARPGDVVARLDGAEFALAFLGVGAEDAHDLAEAALELLAPPYAIGELRLEVAAGAGLAIAPDDETDANALLRSADVAKFHAKGARSRSTLRASSSLREEQRREQRDGEALRAAIERGEIAVHYQPIVEIVTRRIVAVEALARWSHDGVPIPADRFIPLAERTGAIVDLGRAVLERACADAARWHAAGFPLQIAVNVSAIEFRSARFLEGVGAALAMSGLSPTALELELTERIIVDRFDDLMATMSDLRVAGVSLAIDDFGTGFSGLSYVKYFPLDTLKLDRSFVQGRESLDEAIASTVVTLGRRLGLRVVAEGVETEAQLERARTLGCTHAQGWLFAHALAADALVALVRASA